MPFPPRVAGPPRVLQGSFQGRPPAFVQLQAGRPGAPAPHVQAALRRSAPPGPKALQPFAPPARIGSSVQVPPEIDLSRTGPGQPLPAPVLQAMESFFGVGLADVRVHVGRQAPALGAVAFTLGSDLFFAPGQYDPASPHGRRLLGHELAHVVQQRSGRVRNPFGAGLAVVQDPQLEAEAERLGAEAARHAGAAIQRAALPAPVGQAPAIQRMRLANIDPTWDETRKLVKKNASDYGTIAQKDFGKGNEKAFRCPGCRRWLPLKQATVDHIVPKSTLKDVVENQGPEMIETWTGYNKDTYGLTKALDFETIRYRKGGTWRKKTFKDKSKLEDFVAKHSGNDLDNLRLMCHSCNSSKKNRDNAQGSGAPTNPVGNATKETIDFNDGINDHSVDVLIAPGVSTDDCHPSSKFATAWIKTRQFFLGKKYHAAVTTKDFGANGGAEPAYDCPSCGRRLPIAIATVDHIQSKSWYWWLSLDLDNLQLMCNVCNPTKGNR